MSARFPWLLGYISVNIIAVWFMYDSNELIGDFAGFSLYSVDALFWAVTLIICSYFLLLMPTFQFISRIKINPINWGPRERLAGDRIGGFLILLQIGFIMFNLTTGVNIAGAGHIKTDSYFSVFWILIYADRLFFIYYGLYRDNKYFYPNLFIWLLSNLLRGWAGVFLIVLFFEWCRAYRKKKITMIRLTLLVIAVLTLYPLLALLKFMIRSSALTGMTFSAIQEGLVATYTGVDYFSLIGDGLFHIISRLQLTSYLVEVMHQSDLFKKAFSNGEFAPFWMEGFHGIVYDRVLGHARQVNIGVYFTSIYDTTTNFILGD